MKTTTESCMPARFEDAHDLLSCRVATTYAGRVVTAIGACLFACLLLHMDISAPTSSAYASTWPAGSSQGSVCLAFGEAYTFDNSAYTHRGVDIEAKAGEGVKAPLPGTVSFSGRVPAGDSIETGEVRGETMNAVSIALEDGRTVTLMPLGKVEVREGARIAEGDVVGTLAATGDRSSRTPHLHLGLRDGKRYCDPMSLFGAVPARDVETAESVAVPLVEKGSAEQAIAPDAPDLTPREAPSSAEDPLPAVDAEPSFGAISSDTLAETGAEGLKASSEVENPGPLDAIGAACTSQLGNLLAGYRDLGEVFHVPIQLLALGGVLAAVSVAAIFVAGIFALIRRSAAYEKVRKNSSLCKRGEGASIYGLFPAPGTSFITRGRLAQRR